MDNVYNREVARPCGTRFQPPLALLGSHAISPREFLRAVHHGAVSRFLLQLAMLVLCACSRPAQPVRDPSLPDLQLEQVAIRSWSANELQVVTTAQRLDFFREVGTPGEVIAWDAGVLLVGDGTQVSAPMMTGNLFSGQFEGKGGVLMTGPGELRARTPTVAFDRNAGLASGDGGVVLTQPGLLLEASTFSFDLAEQHATFENAKTKLGHQ